MGKRRLTGPLTEIQTSIANRLTAGETQREMAVGLQFSEAYVSGETALVRAKLGAKTTAQACAFWATARAYREAADLLESGRITRPVDETERHVNEVLFGLAGILRERADRLTPQ